jgi:hypothetical protein
MTGVSSSNSNQTPNINGVITWTLYNVPEDKILPAVTNSNIQNIDILIHPTAKDRSVV